MVFWKEKVNSHIGTDIDMNGQKDRIFTANYIFEAE